MTADYFQDVFMPNREPVYTKEIAFLLRARKMRHHHRTMRGTGVVVLTAGLVAASACFASPVSQAFPLPTSPLTDKQSANQTDVVPDERVGWVKNPLITQIRFRDGKLGSNYVEIHYYLSYINSSDRDFKWTDGPAPNVPRIQLYSEGKRIDPAPPPKDDGIMTIRPAPRDEEREANPRVLKAKSQWISDIPSEFVIVNTQFLPGNHVYEIVYWHPKHDWAEIRKAQERPDSQGRGRMRYSITDNAPSNRLYFRVYKPTDEEAREGRHIEFLGEVDASTQVPALPYARPGDYATKTGYWAATGKSIERLGGYYEVFVKEGDSLPNLPGDRGVDPFSFQWKYVGEQSAAAGK
ncbi:hypothetical protein [Burkholderia sp. LMG 21824]|uniref:hypothetical protein n=1 Tax=Burkholderia sp. LMG 21824 TaxID=3158172 RepID=UPI003C2B5679